MKLSNFESSPESFDPGCEENFFTKESPNNGKENSSSGRVIPEDPLRSAIVNERRRTKDLEPIENNSERESSSEENGPESLSKSFIMIPKVARRLSVRNKKRKFPSSKRRAIVKAKRQCLRKVSSSDSDFVPSESDESKSSSEDEGMSKRHNRRLKKYSLRKVPSRGCDFLASESDNSDSSGGDGKTNSDAMSSSGGKANPSDAGSVDADKADSDAISSIADKANPSDAGSVDADKADPDASTKDAERADSDTGSRNTVKAGLVDSGLHECQICHCSYKNYKSLKRHLNTHSKKDKSDFTCKTCKVNFKQKADLDKHMRIHNGYRPYLCDECGKSFTQSSALKRHEKIHLKLKPFSCTDCGASFTQSSSLKRHQNIHLEVKLFECEFCRAAFIEKHHLEQHLNSMHADLTDKEQHRFTCNICQAVFSQKSNLWFHKENLHKTNSKYRCKYCSKTFYSNSNLKRHYGKMHPDDVDEEAVPMPFKCQVCNEGFLKNVGLKLHMRFHDTKDKYRCNVCGNAFKYLPCLRRHQASHRCGSGYACEQCGCKFRSLFLLGLHTKTMKGNCVKDSGPSQSFNPCLKHICKYCNRRFSLSSRLAKHVRKAHPDSQPFTCDVCEKGFSYYLEFRYHRLTHRFIPYQCKTCEVAFPRYKELLQHLSNHSKSLTTSVVSLPSQDAVNVSADIGVYEDVPKSAPDCDLGKGSVETLDSAEEDLEEVDDSRKTSELVAENENQTELDTVDSCTNMGSENSIANESENSIANESSSRTQNPESTQEPQALVEDPTSLKCQDCRLVFLGVFGIRRHRRLTHGDTKYKCEKCYKGFDLCKQLRLHMRTIHPKPKRVKKKKEKKKKSEKIIRPKTAKFMSGKYDKRMTKKERRAMRAIQENAQNKSTAFDLLLKAKVKEALARSKLKAGTANRKPSRKKTNYIID